MYCWPTDIPHGLKAQWEREEKAIRIYEDPACFGASVSSAEELTDREPEAWERELDRLEREEDLSHFDEDGVVFP